MQQGVRGRARTCAHTHGDAHVRNAATRSLGVTSAGRMGGCCTWRTCGAFAPHAAAWLVRQASSLVARTDELCGCMRVYGWQKSAHYLQHIVIRVRCILCRIDRPEVLDLRQHRPRRNGKPAQQHVCVTCTNACKASKAVREQCDAGRSCARRCAALGSVPQQGCPAHMAQPRMLFSPIIRPWAVHCTLQVLMCSGKHTRTHACMHARMHARMHACTHTHTHTHTHTPCLARGNRRRPPRLLTVTHCPVTGPSAQARSYTAPSVALPVM